MLDLPQAMISVMRPSERVISERVKAWAKVLLVSAILAPGKRTVTAALRVMSLSEAAQDQNYHRVLNRAVWSSYRLSGLLLRQVIATFVPPEATIVLGLDDHIERRRGKQIAAKGIYHDAVRAQWAPGKSFFVKTSGLRWLSRMGLARIPWAERGWALPFLPVLAPSAHYHEERGMRHKKRSDWVRQLIRQVGRWLPGRSLVVVMSLLATWRALRQPAAPGCWAL